MFAKDLQTEQELKCIRINIWTSRCGTEMYVCTTQICSLILVDGLHHDHDKRSEFNGNFYLQSACSPC